MANDNSRNKRVCQLRDNQMKLLSYGLTILSFGAASALNAAEVLPEGILRNPNCQEGYICLSRDVAVPRQDLIEPIRLAVERDGRAGVVVLAVIEGTGENRDKLVVLLQVENSSSTLIDLLRTDGIWTITGVAIGRD